MSFVSFFWLFIFVELFVIDILELSLNIIFFLLNMIFKLRCVIYGGEFLIKFLFSRYNVIVVYIWVRFLRLLLWLIFEDSGWYVCKVMDVCERIVNYVINLKVLGKDIIRNI